jgi:L-ribulokinase
MVAIMGTSTCHVMLGESPVEVPGMCGVVRGGIVPEQWGYEAGQSGVGDIFAWYVENAVPPAYHEQARALGVSVHEHLAALGEGAPVGWHGLVALDWWSGNRSVLVDHELSGALIGMTLATRPHEVYRALVEATAFGTRRIIDAFNEAGVPVAELVAAGGLLRNEPLMRCYADVLGMPIGVIESDQGPALGSAMHAAVAAGVHADIYAAAQAMGRARRDVYEPDGARASAYDELYALYRRLHDHFGIDDRGLMRELQAIRERGAREGGPR